MEPAFFNALTEPCAALFRLVPHSASREHNAVRFKGEADRLRRYSPGWFRPLQDARAIPNGQVPLYVDAVSACYTGKTVRGPDGISWLAEITGRLIEATDRLTGPTVGRHA